MDEGFYTCVCVVSWSAGMVGFGSGLAFVVGVGTAKCLVPPSPRVITRLNFNHVGHFQTVTLFYSCSRLRLHRRVKNKVFHTRLLLTFHWLLG